jgi:hypothetical protein
VRVQKVEKMNVCLNFGATANNDENATKYCTSTQGCKFLLNQL